MPQAGQEHSGGDLRYRRMQMRQLAVGVLAAGMPFAVAAALSFAVMRAERPAERAAETAATSAPRCEERPRRVRIDGTEIAAFAVVCDDDAPSIEPEIPAETAPVPIPAMHPAPVKPNATVAPPRREQARRLLRKPVREWVPRDDSMREWLKADSQRKY